MWFAGMRIGLVCDGGGVDWLGIFFYWIVVFSLYEAGHSQLCVVIVVYLVPFP